MKTILPLLLYFFCLVISCTETTTGEPANNITDQQKDSISSENDVWPMVKSVSWNVGITHKLEFFYNPDSSLNYYLSGSSNLPSKYKTQFIFKNRKLDEAVFENTSVSRFLYNDSGKVKELKNINNGVETSRRSYIYDPEGRIQHLESEVLMHGVLTTTWESSFNYDAEGNIIKTTTINYDENGEALDTIQRNIQQTSPPLDLNPYSLLHPLYQHQAQEIFDLVVLNQIKKLPVKISESGRSSTGPINYKYFYTISDKLLMKVKCRIAIGNNPAYDTAEALFQY
ncbi:hypothetical protein [Desertivirga brevis]|uniref:hypothetical protein n=1 Tax=Desertivirga brevis TaxID=2810310 RepID=UPI001A95B925|nr:hypothetical protein [Pedobacter sp. SYSU D00873]